jgi:hypothetical protein
VAVVVAVVLNLPTLLTILNKQVVLVVLVLLDKFCYTTNYVGFSR